MNPLSALLPAERPPPRLLVVDDQPVNIQAIYQAFQADHQVLMATSGPQALQVAVDRQPDLILLDVVMPGMDGHEVCRRLKADPSTCDIPVIFVTAHNDAKAETDGLALGAVDFISKPINPAVVRARVKTHLTLKAQSDLLRQWVYIDGLTGVSNRRCFDERLAMEWARARREGSTVSLMMIDVDHFKHYNDRHGHQAGDECLRRLATSLRQAIRRPGDLLARYGGEEFACLLPSTPLEGAMQLAGAMCRGVESLALPHQELPERPVATVSIGAVSSSDPVVGGESAFVRAADEQLYAAKAQGRNRVCGVELSAVLQAD